MPAASIAKKIPPLGAHMSIAGGTPNAIKHALSVESTTVQIFLKNNNQWAGKTIGDAEAEAFQAAVAAAKFTAPPVAHASYLINLGSSNPELAQKSAEAMADELRRAALLGVPGVVVHPGAHKGFTAEECLSCIAERANQALRATEGLTSAIYFETTAGQGSSLGHAFEHLAVIIEGIEDKSRVAVCLDTCHVFAAGYDIRTAAGVKAMLKEFDRIIGLGRLVAIHVNDSKKPLGSRVDRHEHIGKGMIGEEGFAALLQDKRLNKIPFILETPKEDDLAEDRINLATLRRLATAELRQ